MHVPCGLFYPSYTTTFRHEVHNSTGRWGQHLLNLDLEVWKLTGAEWLYRMYPADRRGGLYVAPTVWTLSHCFWRLFVFLLHCCLGRMDSTPVHTEAGEAQSTELASFKSYKYVCRFLWSAFYVPGTHLYMLLLTLKKCCMGRICFPILLVRKPRLGEGGICSRSHSEIKDNWDLRSDLSITTNKHRRQQLLWLLLRLAANIYSALALSQAPCWVLLCTRPHLILTTISGGRSYCPDVHFTDVETETWSLELNTLLEVPHRKVRSSGFEPSYADSSFFWCNHCIKLPW